MLDFQENQLVLTPSGNLHLFKMQNANSIRDFIIKITAAGYDPSLLDDYLLTQNLNIKIFSVLDDVNDFFAFCDNYYNSFKI